MVDDAKLDPDQRARAVSLVSKYGKGLTDSCLRIFTNYVVLGIASECYSDDVVKDIAIRMSEEFKNVRNFHLGDVRFAKIDAKLNEYFQSMLEDPMSTNYDDDGLYKVFIGDANRASFTIGGEEFRIEDHNSNQMIDKFKETIPNSQHRKAISTFMCQTGNLFYTSFADGRGLKDTSKFPKADLTSVKGYDLLLAPNYNDEFFTMNSIFKPKGVSTYTLEVSDDGKKAKLTAHLAGDVLFRIANSQDCSENATSNFAYETEFEFDLSNENEAKLTGVHFSQVLGMPESQEPQAPKEQEQLDEIRMPKTDED